MTPLRIVGILLVVLGIVALVAGGLSYSTQNEVLDVGELEVAVEERHGFAVPPLVSALAIAAGLALLVIRPRRA